jgi:hypothetical protein
VLADTMVLQPQYLEKGLDNLIIDKGNGHLTVGGQSSIGGFVHA